MEYIQQLKGWFAQHGREITGFKTKTRTVKCEEHYVDCLEPFCEDQELKTGACGSLCLGTENRTHFSDIVGPHDAR